MKMIINIFLKFAFLSLFHVSIIHGRFLDGIDIMAAGLPGGLCSAVTTHGYKCSEYTVTTDDGYLLGVQRIPEGRSGSAGPGVNQPRPPVLLQHGLFVDGMTWVMSPPEESLAMILADNGFDVWISNFRGTRSSRRHVTLNPILPAFWNWTWDELAHHDLLSVINYIFKETGQQMHYVGHSMGTMTALTLLSENKFVNVKSAALLCPIAYLSHIISRPLTAAADIFLGEVGVRLGVVEFNPRGLEAENIIRGICSTMNCNHFMSLLSGRDCCLNPPSALAFLVNGLQPTSTKNLVHFAQDVRTGILAKFDYVNPIENFAHYGAARPPIFDLTKIPTNFPLFISYGGQDALSVTQDVVLLLDKLKAHEQDKLQVQNIPQYAHVDYILAYNAKELVYNNVTDFFRRHN